MRLHLIFLKRSITLKTQHISQNKISYALEWIDLTYQDKNKLVLQHILQMGRVKK